MSTALPIAGVRRRREDGVRAPPIVRTCRSIPIGLLLVANRGTVSSSRVVRTVASVDAVDRGYYTSRDGIFAAIARLRSSDERRSVILKPTFYSGALCLLSLLPF